MRTTLAIDEDLLRRLKELAAHEGRTLQSLVNDLLRRALALVDQRKPFKLEIQGWKTALQPGADILDRDKLLDLMEDR